MAKAEREFSTEEEKAKKKLIQLCADIAADIGEEDKDI